MGIVHVMEQRSKHAENVFERVRNDALVHMTHTMPIEAVEWFRRNIDFNVADVGLISIMSVMDLMEVLRGRSLSDDEYFKAAVLEWCIKLLQASRSYIYSDDKQHKHRKKQCWYAGDDIVIRDSLWLEVVMYYLLKRYFRTETYYVHLLELFQDTTFQTEMGQLVNVVTASKDHADLSKFTLQKHALSTRNKFTSFYLPVALAMCVCGVPETYTIRECLFSPYTTARSILLLLGEYFQVQNDFFHYVSTVDKAGETGSDTMENKCSWCVCVALVVSSAEDRRALEANYGQADPEKERQVRQVYERIGMREQYRVYEAGLREQIEGSIAEIPEPERVVDGGMLKREVFLRFFDEIRKRIQ